MKSSIFSRYLPPLAIALAFAMPRPAIAQEPQAQEPAGSTSRTTGKVIDDSVITGKVKTKLIKDDNIEAFKINVDTRNGVVELNGTVERAEQKELAEKLAGEVKGVQMVDNRLKVAQK